MKTIAIIMTTFLSVLFLESIAGAGDEVAIGGGTKLLAAAPAENQTEVGENERGSSNVIKMHGKCGNGGKKWFDCPKGAAIVGVYGRLRKSKDFSVERFRFRRLSGGSDCKFVFGASEDIKINDKGSKVFKCPPNYVVTGVFYQDYSDNSIERIRCTELSIDGPCILKFLVGEKVKVKKGWNHCSSDHVVTAVHYLDDDPSDDYVDEIHGTLLNLSYP